MFLRTTALGAALLIAPLALAAADQETPAPATATEPQAKPADKATTSDTAAPDAAVEEKRICKSVRADPSSRRKTRVCRTMAEWRELNVPT